MSLRAGGAYMRQWTEPLLYQLMACRLCDKLFSDIWVRYPRFSGHKVKIPIQTTMAPRLSCDLIGCIPRSKWGLFVDLLLANRKYIFRTK